MRGGFLAAHDYGELCPDVKTVVDERFGAKATVIGEIWLVPIE